MTLIKPIPHPIHHPIIHLPTEIELYDFGQVYDPNRSLLSDYGVGKYNEHRPGMYTGDLFEDKARTVHMGIDIGCPVGTPVYAFDDGVILHQGYNSAPFDYGHVIVTEHIDKDGSKFWVLLGHLSKTSLQRHSTADPFKKGDLLGWIGASSENGGWNPHLHIQLSTVHPLTHDLPGVVSLLDRNNALKQYPDPRCILGNIYTC